MNDVVVALLSD